MVMLLLFKGMTELNLKKQPENGQESMPCDLRMIVHLFQNLEIYI
jgi:hypothetical protein